MLPIKAIDLKGLFEGYMEEYDESILRGDLTQASNVLQLIDEVINEFRGPCLIVAKTKIH